MTNYFIQIWIILKELLKTRKVETWKIIWSFIATIIFIILFILTNKVHEERVEFALNHIYGTSRDSLILDLKFNRGIFENANDDVYNTMYLNSYTLADSSKTIDFKLFEETELKHFETICKDENVLIQDIQGIYETSLANTIPWYIRFPHVSRKANRPKYYQNQFISLPISKSIYKKGGYRYNKFCHKTVWLTSDIQYKYRNRTARIAKYRSFFSPYDISQECIYLNLDSNVNYIELGINCYGPVEFSAMTPSPDSIYMDRIVFKDQNKISKIKSSGLRFHTKYVQLENLQSMRAFMITTFLSLFITLFCTLSFKHIKLRIKIAKRYIRFKSLKDAS